MSIARMVCVPSGTFAIVYRPSSLARARSCVPTMKTWALASGRPEASVTRPETTVAAAGRTTGFAGTTVAASAAGGLPTAPSAVAAQRSVSRIIFEWRGEVVRTATAYRLVARSEVLAGSALRSARGPVGRARTIAPAFVAIRCSNWNFCSARWTVQSPFAGLLGERRNTVSGFWRSAGRREPMGASSLPRSRPAPPGVPSGAPSVRMSHGRAPRRSRSSINRWCSRRQGPFPRPRASPDSTSDQYPARNVWTTTPISFRASIPPAGPTTDTRITTEPATPFRWPPSVRRPWSAAHDRALTGAELVLARPVADPNAHPSGPRGSEPCLPHRTVLPVDVHLDPSARPQPAHPTGRPRGWQRRKQVDLSGVALEEHLGDPRRRAEVAVDLKRRVRVEQVGVDTAAAGVVRGRAPRRLEQVGEDYERVVAVAHARPEVGLPRHRPAGRLVAADLHRAARRGVELRRPLARDLAAGMDAEQMREVPVLRILFLEVFGPLLELAALADLIGDETGARLANPFAERGVGAEHRGRLDRVGEQIPHECTVHRHPRAHRRGAAPGHLELQLGRRGRQRDELPLGVGREDVEVELARRLHHRIRARAQVLHVAAEGVVLPEVLRQPCRSAVPVRPHGIALAEVAHRRRLRPDVTVVMRHPAARVVIHLRGAVPVHRDALDEVDERLVHLGEVRALRRPVVHLRVDVDRVVRTPG